MPELPEVESARAVVERSALDRRIDDVDDTDTWVCRPHSPGEIRAALLGRRELVAAHRRGKSMWVETSGDHVLGIHLGMSGRILVTERGGRVDEGGDYVGTRPQRTPVKPEWDRFTLHFADGGALRLFDKRRASAGSASTPTSRPSARTPARSGLRTSGSWSVRRGRR